MLALKSGAVKPASQSTTAQPTSQSTTAQPQQERPRQQQAAQAPVDTSAVNERYTDIPNSSMRKTIAKRLTQSKTGVPHYYTAVEVGMYV